MRAGLLVLLTAGAACNALPAVAIDEPVTGPFHDRRSPAATDEAGGGNDGAGSEAAAESDGADEAGADRKVTTSWCEARRPMPIFCDDFDRGDIGARWDYFLQSPPGWAALDDVERSSGRWALAIFTAPLNDAEPGNILLRKTVAGSAARATLGFDVLAEGSQPTGTLAIATLDLSAFHLLTLYLRDDDPLAPGPALVEVLPGTSKVVRNALPRIPPAGRWTRVELDADTANGTLSLRFDGAVVLDNVALARAPTDQPTIRIGVLTSGPAAPYAFHFDDVTLDVTP